MTLWCQKKYSDSGLLFRCLKHAEIPWLPEKNEVGLKFSSLGHLPRSLVNCNLAQLHQHPFEGLSFFLFSLRF